MAGIGIKHPLVLGALVALGLGIAQTASAGICPPEHVVADGEGQKAGATAPKGVADTVLGSIELANEIPGLEGRDLRLRELVVQPGGVVPWHSHDDRPAIIYIVAGTITEYRSTCSVPIVHKAGHVALETRGTAHWWKNEGKKVVKLLSSDIFHEMDQADAHTM